MKRNNPLLIFLITLLSIPSVALGLSSGITGYSGQSGQTCSNCHTGGTTPTVTLTTASTNIMPGATASFTLSLNGGQQNAAGFGVSGDGGVLVNTLGNIAQINGGELIHSQAISVGNTATDWIIDWQAPTTEGIYNLYATVVSANGDGNSTGDAAASAQIQVVVSATGNVPPTASFTAPNTVIQGLQVNFDANASNDVDGNITDYSWNFGDGTTDNGVTVAHTFANTGNFTVSLAVTDDGGLSQTTTKTISVVAAGTPIPPTADIGGPYSGEAGQDISFDANNSTDTDGSVARYLWDFGDGSAITQGATPVHAFANAGTYTVTLAVTDNDGLTNAIATTVQVGAVKTGAQLFAEFCSACHHNGSGGDVSGADANKIQSAINGVNEMNGINLTSAEIQRIAQFMANGGGSGGGGGGGGGGQALYDSNCAGCHGAGGAGGLARAIQGTTVNAVNNAINTVPSMGNINLTQAEIQDIVTYLANSGGGGGGGGGQALYDANCLGCHGAGGVGGLARAIQGTTVNAVNNAINTVPSMGNINLTQAEIQDIVTYLANSTGGGGGTPTDGLGLYNTFCMACHGAEGGGGSAVAIIGADSARITSAISNVGAMNGLSLTNEQINLIAGYLATVSKPTDGAGLFQAFCDSCHGPNGSEGSVNGASASKIADAIDKEQAMNFLGGILTSQDIQLISTYLNNNGGD